MTTAATAIPPKATRILRDIAGDPALGFALCSIIYASKATTVALVCAFVCTFLIIALRIARHIDTTLLPAHIARRLHDDGLTLRVLGTLGLVASLYTFIAIMLGRYDGADISMAMLHGCAGILFAVANFMLATSMTGARAQRSPLATLFLQAETWLLGGMVCLGLMTGVHAVLMLPFMISGYMITLSNIRHQRGEHVGHPKLFYAAATLGFAIASPDGWLLFANILNAFCLVAIEHRLTPGGLWRSMLPVALQTKKEQTCC